MATEGCEIRCVSVSCPPKTPAGTDDVQRTRFRCSRMCSSSAVEMLLTSIITVSAKRRIHGSG